MPRVALFVTCIVDQLFPQAGLAMATVLERLGYEVDFPEDQTCCGQPAFNSGYAAEARAVAAHTVKVMESADYIVVASGSCATMIGRHYAELLGGEPLKGRVFEFSQFLTDVVQVEDVGAHFDGVVTYHDSCHALRELTVKQGPRRLLSRVRGLELREMEPAEECCGFGGTFSVKFSGISGAMARSKLDAVVATGATTVVSIDSSCLMQIQGAAARAGVELRTMHLAEILAAR